MAGRGGLNLTHSEPFDAFVARYGGAAARLRPMLEAFPPAALIAWAEALGQPTFVGSSGRVFPEAMKASPLLRAWLARLSAAGVALRPGYTWLGWADDGALRMRNPDGEIGTSRPDAVVLALGGASWPRLGSNGAWADVLSARGVVLVPFRPANGGFLVDWSETFGARFAGSPLKTVALTFDGHAVRGEAMVTRRGIEGGAVYALGARLRDAVDLDGSATLFLDIRPDLMEAALIERLAKPRGGGSLANHLRKAGLTPVAINLLREGHGLDLPTDPAALARLIKAAPIRIVGAAPIERAISTAGGIAFDACGRAADVEGGARRVRRRRDAGLGSADRRLPLAGLVRDGRCGGPRRLGLAGPLAQIHDLHLAACDHGDVADRLAHERPRHAPC